MTKETKQAVRQAEEEIRKEFKQENSGLSSYFHSLFDIRDNMLTYEEIDTMMREQTVIHGANMWILMLAILIASIGLNVNSTAVIIGAMLISPLMSGIMSMGYSIAVRDISLLLKALVRFGTQVVICLVSSTIYFKLSPLTAPTAELIARTSPTTWDVLIATFGGLAGMIGHTRTKHSNVIPGVAIATALMPPICTAGYGIATGQVDFFLGAFYLFIINTLFIAISTGIITLILKVPYHRSISKKQQHRVNAVILTITILVIIPSFFMGAYTVYNSFVDSTISNYLDTEFEFSDAQLVKSETDKDNKIITVSLVGTPITEEDINHLKEKLTDYGLGDYTLKITQNVFTGVTDVDDENSDKITIILQENIISDLQTQLETQSEELENLQGELEEYEKFHTSTELSSKATQIFPKITQCSVGIMYDSEGEMILMTAQTESTLSETELETVKNWLKTESGISRAEVYAVETAPEPEPLTPTVPETNTDTE